LAVTFSAASQEGMMTVTTVRDFSVVFDAYMQFEESMLSAKMEQLEQDLDEEDAVDEDEDVRAPATRSPLSSDTPKPWFDSWTLGKRAGEGGS